MSQEGTKLTQAHSLCRFHLAHLTFDMTLEFIECSTVHEREENEWLFVYHKLVYRDIQRKRYYLAYCHEKYVNPDPKDAKLFRIPLEAIFPPVPRSLPLVLWYEQVPYGCYLKRPKLLHYDKDHSLDPAKILLHEFCIHQALEASPHINIAPFVAGLVKDGYLKGIILPSYPRSLQEKLETDEPIQVEKIIKGVKAALAHLHKRGLVYMNLEPRHIMLRDNDEPVLVGFSYCQFRGDTCYALPQGDWIKKIPNQLLRSTSPLVDFLALVMLREQLVTRGGFRR